MTLVDLESQRLVHVWLIILLANSPYKWYRIKSQFSLDKSEGMA